MGYQSLVLVLKSLGIPLWMQQMEESSFLMVKSQFTTTKIISNTRTLLGGINMVDSGVTTDYNGSVIANNFIISNTSMIKIGIARGPQSWGADNSTRTTGGTFVNNTLTSGSSGYFAFGS
jgi:hypothetical protein